MRQAGSPIIDPENINNEHLEGLESSRWDFPDDFDPSGVRDYQAIYKAVIAHLVNHKGSPTYLLSLTSELEKYLQWAFRVCNKSPFIQSEQDISEYFEFVKSPPESWTSKGNQKKFVLMNGERIANKKWKPFRAPKGTIKNSGTVKKSYSALSSFFSYSLNKKLIKTNPLSFIPKATIFPKVKTSSKYDQKILMGEDRELLERTLELLVIEDEKYTRENLIILMMLNMYLRVSDLAEYKGVLPVFGDFYFKRQSGWWFDAYGKGNKVGDIAVNEKVVAAMKAYRQYRGLLPCPYASEETPLIVDRFNKRPVRTTSHIATIIKDVMSIVIDKAIGLKWNEQDISRLKSFSSHWLRHTGISNGVMTRPVEHVRRDARHASFETTSHYMDSDERARHESSQG